jgi:hypothetical protein
LNDNCIEGYDYYDDDDDPMYEFGHGTHVSGIIGAEGNNGTGVCGVSWDISILPLRCVKNKKSGVKLSSAISCFYNAIGAGAHIINCSWGDSKKSNSLKEAINSAQASGILVICAAGNDGINIDFQPHYPASYNNDNIIAVAATDENDKLTNISNYGINSVDIAAPGEYIWSTIPYNEYESHAGTSMSAPFVTGVAALLKSFDSSLEYNEIKQIILDSVDKKDYLNGKVSCGGRLNVFNYFLPPSQVTINRRVGCEFGGCNDSYTISGSTGDLFSLQTVDAYMEGGNFCQTICPMIYFTEWTKSGPISIIDADSAITKFEITDAPGTATITANYFKVTPSPTPIPTPSTKVRIESFDSAGNKTTSAKTGTAGESFEIKTVTTYMPGGICPGVCTHNEFSHWEATGPVSIKDPNSPNTSSTIKYTTGPGTITPHYRAINKIVASADDHGSISPNGTIRVPEGENKTFSIKADSGYEIDTLTVDDKIDDKATGKTSYSYTFSNVDNSYIINATFRIRKTEVTITIREGCEYGGCQRTYSVTGQKDDKFDLKTVDAYMEGDNFCPTICPMIYFTEWSKSGSVSIDDPDSAITKFEITDAPGTATITANYIKVAPTPQPASVKVTVIFYETNESGYGSQSTWTKTCYAGDRFSIETLNEFAPYCPGHVCPSWLYFKNWDVNCDSVKIKKIKDNTTSFTITRPISCSEATITANYNDE